MTSSASVLFWERCIQLLHSVAHNTDRSRLEVVPNHICQGPPYEDDEEKVGSHL